MSGSRVPAGAGVDESMEKNRPKIKKPAMMAATSISPSVLLVVQSDGQSLPVDPLL